MGEGGERGTSPPVMPEPQSALNPSFEIQHRIPRSQITDDTPAHCSASAPDKRSVSLLKAHRSIKATPFPSADVHDDGKLEYQRTLTWEKKTDILT